MNAIYSLRMIVEAIRMTLKEIKDYLRIDSDITYDDTLIEALHLAAIQYIQEATGKTYDDSNELYKLLVKILITHWYENREAVQEAGRAEVPYSITALLNHIALASAHEV